MKHIVFVGQFYNPEYEKEILLKSKVGLPVALQKMQMNLISIFSESKLSCLRAVGSLPVGNFPDKYKKMVIHKQKYCLDKKVTTISLGYINIPLLKDKQKEVELFQILSRE